MFGALAYAVAVVVYVILYGQRCQLIQLQG